jgi:hypothetical protein
VTALWNRYWHGGPENARGAVLAHAVLFVLAFDCWVELAAHGARYGQGRFNVAHFAWLDAVQPVPGPTLYVGLVIFSGLLAFALAASGRASGGSRVAAGLLAVSYTYAWAMSLLDSYQHHYLLSLYLGLFVLLPATFAARLLSVTTGVVYLFTGLAKTEADWRSGAALARIAAEPMKPFLSFASRLGIDEAQFWPLVGTSVIALQFFVALGYLLAPAADAAADAAATADADAGHRGLRVVSGLAWFAAMAFHIGAEVLELRVGWFSYYMMLVASVLLLPAPWVDAVASLARRARAHLTALATDATAGGWTSTVVLAAAASAVLFGMGRLVDLPGAGIACASVPAVLVGMALLEGTPVHRASAWASAAASLVGAALLWGALAASEARYDYYRFAGGDAKKRGTPAEALLFYQKAQAYAPEGVDRSGDIEALRARASSPAE